MNCIPVVPLLVGLGIGLILLWPVVRFRLDRTRWYHIVGLLAALTVGTGCVVIALSGICPAWHWAFAAAMAVTATMAARTLWRLR